jgi:hypothetical protein
MGREPGRRAPFGLPTAFEKYPARVRGRRPLAEFARVRRPGLATAQFLRPRARAPCLCPQHLPQSEEAAPALTGAASDRLSAIRMLLPVSLEVRDEAARTTRSI